MASDIEMLVNKNGNEGSSKTHATTKPAKAEPGSSKLIHYTKHRLLELSTVPLSCKKPKCFTEDRKVASLSCLRGTAKPTAHGRHKKVSAPVGRETGGTASDEADTTAAAAAAAAATTVPVSQHKKAPADRRQRLQAEEDCLVLSPQRRSFTTGCQAPPSAKSDDAADREIHRELPTRRVGSGRIVSRDEGRCRPAAGGRWERLDVRLDKAEQRPERLDERRTDRERRGGFGRDWLAGSERPASSGFGREPGQGGSGRRRPERPERRSRADDQPEWFSAGPTSQNDMVELHGFGDEGGADPPTAAEPEHGPAECSAPTAQHKQEKVSSGPGGGGPFLDDPAIQSTIQHHGAPGAHLDLDAILRCDMDALPGPSAVGGAAASVGFSRWFRRQSPPAAAAAAPDQQPPSSLHHQLVGNIINGLELSLKLPSSEPEAYFAPISPAQSSNQLKDDLPHQQTADAAQLAAKLAALGGSGQRTADSSGSGHALVGAGQPPPTQHSQDAFRRLVSQLRASEAPLAGEPAPLPQPAASQVLAEPGAPPAPASVVPPDHAVTQDNLVKLLHMQQQHQQQHQLEQQQQQQQMAAAQNLEQLLTMRRPPSPAAAPIEQLMAIPEARSILIGLQTGRLSRHSLVQQLHSQVLQPRLRDIIVAVLRLPQQRVSPLPEPPHAVGQQHLSSAPAPHRVPSPQEMRLHTQHILQQALIKRKLEEQKENFRKRQENRDKCAPLDGDRRRQASSTAASLAFTPTAVIRNMKAEARSSPEHRPKGRPLVKTNRDGPPPAAAVSAGNIQSVAAKLLETQAQMQQPPWLQRGRGAAAQPAAAGALSRWFSPELLASAHLSAPPSMQQRVLSVEELERHQAIN